MKKGLLAAVLVLLACAGSALADGEPTPHWDYWVDAGFINWWLQGAPLPTPLVTTGLQTGFPNIGSGVLGQGGTGTVLGDNRMQASSNQGGQVTAGTWLDYTQDWAVTGNFFMLATRTLSTGAGSDGYGYPLLTRPVVDARTNQETVEFISSPTAFSGGLTVNTSASLMGAESNLVTMADRFEGGYFNLLAGFRWVELREELDMAQSTQGLTNGVPFFQGNPLLYSHINIDDNFRTRNDFLGGQVGAQVGYAYSRFLFNLAGKLGLGDVREQVKIDGSTTATNILGKSATVPGGLLALPTNMGTFSRNAFALLPSVDATVMFEINSQIHLLVGYNLLYLTDVARPGDQIDRNINRTQLPTSQTYNPGAGGPNSPGFTFHGSDFWAQGFTAGLSLWF
jgi:hypothetical protein